MKIKAVAKNSIADEVGIRPGDDLVRINGYPIRDDIDFRYYCSEEEVELDIRRNGDLIRFEIEKDPDDLLGIELEEFRTRSCGNKCIFCFTDQNPKGMRPSLYFKDEDYRMSFLYGHYTTLTNVGKRDLERIVQQRLSPLYISVHATDLERRKVLLGIKRDDHLLEKIDFLTRHGIELHTQIVLCPGINDGEVLDQTITDLASYEAGVVSIAVVPVGLTAHRQGLPELRPVTKQDARKVIGQIEEYQKRFLGEKGSRFVYPSDEFFIKADVPIPNAAYYGDFPQIEDGVGMVRLLLDNFRDIQGELPSAIGHKKRFTFLSGTSAAPFFEKYIIPILNQIQGVDAAVISVTNRFYGEDVTVSGLLTGQDFARTIQDNKIVGTVLIPSKCLNKDVLFLDDWTVERLEQETGCDVNLMDDFLNGLPEFIGMN